MNTSDSDDRPEQDDRSEQRPAPEVHREREIIVTGSDGRGSGVSTAIVVIFALVALAIITFLAFTFLERSGDEDGMLPGDVDITIEVPSIPNGS